MAVKLTRAHAGVALGLVSTLVLLGNSSLANEPETPPRYNQFSASELQSSGFEFEANKLIAEIRDSSFGPTVVLDSSAATGSVDEVAFEAGTLAFDASKDVDRRIERTESPGKRGQEIAKDVALSRSGERAVANLITEYRAIEERATGGYSDVDIIASTVEPVNAIATHDAKSNKVLVSVTSYITEQYRSGVLSEAYETTNVIFDADSGEVLTVRPVTEQELAASTSGSVDDGLVGSDDGVEADTRRLARSETTGSELSIRGMHNGSYGPTFVAAAMTNTQRSAVVAYANKHWSSYNTYYRSFTNDCTNFVSQAMKAGGWGYTNTLITQRTDDRHWGYNKYGGWQTYSWAGAENWFKFARVNSGRVTALTSVYSMRGGDILQVKYKGATAIHHSMIVTKYYGGEIYLTYHSADRHNKSFSWYSAQYSGETYYAQKV